MVDALGRGQVGRADAVQPMQRVLPVREAGGLRARIHLRQFGPQCARLVLVPCEPLLEAPLPFGPVDGLEAGIGPAGRLGDGRCGGRGGMDGGGNGQGRQHKGGGDQMGPADSEQGHIGHSLAQRAMLTSCGTVFCIDALLRVSH